MVSIGRYIIFNIDISDFRPCVGARVSLGIFGIRHT